MNKELFFKIWKERLSDTTDPNLKIISSLCNLSEEEIVEKLNSTDVNERTIIKYQENRKRFVCLDSFLLKLLKILANLSDAYMFEGDAPGFWLHYRVNQCYVFSRLEKESDWYLSDHEQREIIFFRLLGQAIVFEFDGLISVSYGSLMLETHLILPFLRRLNEMGVITYEACSGYAKFHRLWPSFNCYIHQNQKEKLGSISYLVLKEEKKTIYGVNQNFESSYFFVQVQVKPSYYDDYISKGQNPFWVDVVEAIEKSEVSTFDWKSFFED